MSFHAELVAQTEIDRRRLMGLPFIQNGLRGEVALPTYMAFLHQTYHQAHHALPLLRACQAALPAHHHGLRPDLEALAQAESEHGERLLADLSACGADLDAWRDRPPRPSIEMMVAYAYDTVTRRNPLGLLGLWHVREHMRATLSQPLADRFQRGLRLPDAALRYLRSHGTAGAARSARIAALLDRIPAAQDQADIVHATRMYHRLYGDMFRSLPLPAPRSHVALAS